jgi:hypothetical protein
MELQITMNIKKRYFFLLLRQTAPLVTTTPNPRQASLGGSIPRSAFTPSRTYPIEFSWSGVTTSAGSVLNVVSGIAAGLPYGKQISVRARDFLSG